MSNLKNRQRVLIIGVASAASLIASKLSEAASVEIVESAECLTDDQKFLLQNGYDKHLLDNCPVVEQVSPHARRVRKSKGERKRNKRDRWA